MSDAMVGAGGEVAGADAAAMGVAKEKATEAEARVEARKKQWDKQQVPDELLASGDDLKKPWEDDKGNKLRAPIHAVFFKEPRNGKISGYIDESVLQDPQIKTELMRNGVVSYKEDDLKQERPTFDAHAEYGGTKKYSRFVTEMDDVTNSDPTKLFTHSGDQNRGIIPKEGVSQQAVALAFDLWNEKQKLEEFKKQDQKIQASASDDGMVGTGEDSTTPAAQSDETIQSEEKIKTLQEQLDKKTKEDQEAQNIKNLQEKKITEPEAQEMLKKLKELEQKERELRKKLANAKSPEEKSDLELQLKQLTKDKFSEILQALGYSVESVAQLLSNESNLPAAMQLARHTSRSKDLQSPAVREICRLAKHELISSVQELINKTEDDGKKSSWDTIRTMKAFKALRIAMEAMGITGSAQDAKIAELQQSTNERGLSIKPEGSKNTQGENVEDTLTVLLEALVTGEPVPDVVKSFKTYFDDLKKEFAKTGKNIEEFDDWARERIKELHPEVGEAAAIFVANFLDKHLDMGAFMEMLLTGDSSLSLARDLGYKSKEQLKAEGKEPVGVEEVDVYVRANGNHAENARKLLLVGLKDIIREENRDALFNRPATGVLRDESFREMLKKSVDKEHHKIFATQILTELKFGDEKTQELRKTTLTDEAFSYIMNLPLLAEKLNWQDGEGVAEQKKDDVKKEEKKVEAPTTEAPSAESAQVEGSTPQAQSQPVAEVKT